MDIGYPDELSGEPAIPSEATGPAPATSTSLLLGGAGIYGVPASGPGCASWR